MNTTEIPVPRSVEVPTLAGQRKPPHVAISGATLGLGGIRTHLLLLCRLLRREGVDVSVFATGSHWDEECLAAVRSIGVRFVMPPAPLWRFRQVSSLFASLRWPLVFPRDARALYCIGAGRSHLLLHRIRNSRTPSINHEIVEPPGPDSLAGQCAATLDCSVANSRKVAAMMQGLWPQKPIRVIPFLTSDKPSPPPPPRPAVGNRVLRVTYLGRLVAQKRPDHLVRCWNRLSGQMGLGPARLDVYGYDPEGSMLREMRATVSESGMGDRVAIHGEYTLADLPGILERSDVVVLPSLWEGLPLVLVEAMLKGVPFVACAAGGTEELGVNNPDVIVTGTNWDEFEDGLMQMARRIRVGAVDASRLHAWAEARYGYDAVARRWMECLGDPRAFFGLP